MTAYPGAIPSLVRPAHGDPGADGSATDATVVIDAISDEVEAIATELGVNPSGAAATVVARLDALDTTVGGKAATSHTHSTSDVTSLAEYIRDTIGATLVAGSNIAVTVDDAGDTITLAVTGSLGLTSEQVMDTVASMLTAGSNISLTYNDAGDTLTVAVTGLGGAATLNVGTTAGTVAAGDDSRLTNSRTPTAHASSHLPGGSDALTTAAGSTQAFGDSAAAGSAASFSRSDHKHAMPADPTGKPLALTGATAATRYVGATASGAPASGTFAVGDFVIEQTGKVYVCTVAGTPGTWVQVGGSGSGYATVQDEASSLTARATVDFRGVGVTATDDSAGSRTRVTIPGPAPRTGASVTHFPLMSGSVSSFGTYQRCYFIPFIGTGNGFNSATVLVDAGGASGVVRLGCYTYDGSSTLSLVTDWGTVAATGAGYGTASFSAWTPTAGTTYYLAVVCQGNSAVRVRGGTVAPYAQSLGANNSAIPPVAAFYTDSVTGALSASDFAPYYGRLTDQAPWVTLNASVA